MTKIEKLMGVPLAKIEFIGVRGYKHLIRVKPGSIELGGDAIAQIEGNGWVGLGRSLMSFIPQSLDPIPSAMMYAEGGRMTVRMADLRTVQEFVS